MEEEKQRGFCVLIKDPSYALRIHGAKKSCEPPHLKYLARKEQRGGRGLTATGGGVRVLGKETTSDKLLDVKNLGWRDEHGPSLGPPLGVAEGIRE